MSTMRIDVDGLTQAVSSFKVFEREVSDLNDAFRNIGADTVATARAKAPKLTGRLAGSIQATNGTNEVTITAGSGLEYAGVQEYGWAGHNIEGQHYMYRALDVGNALEEVDGSIDKVIRRLGL